MSEESSSTPAIQSLSETPHSDWNPWSPEATADPFAAQAELRSRCPVAYTSEKGGFWSITKYADVVEAATDVEHFKNGLRPVFALPAPPLESDPPEHTWYRKLLQPFFTPSRMKVIEGQIREFAVEILDPLIARGEADIANEFSFLLPVRAFCFLLNLPGDDWPRIREWSKDAYSVFAKIPEMRARYDASNQAIYDYARGVLAERRVSPRDPEDDLMSCLIAARYNGEPLSDDMIVGAVRLLLTAGHESTASSISNCILYLARNPEAQAELRSNPLGILTGAEEILRWESPIMGMPRVVAAEVEVGGHTFQKDDYVYLLYASANRDEEKFQNADQCILSRKPNPHMVFGWGRHTCLGAPLARVELLVALEELLGRTESFSVSGEVERTIFHRRGVLSLPLRIAPRSQGFSPCGT